MNNSGRFIFMSRVALIGENSTGYVKALIDIWNNGDCAVLLDWRIPFPTLIQMMSEADVHICFIEKSLLDKIEHKIDSVNFISYEKENRSAELLPDGVYEKFRDNYSRNEAVVIYSSGTTGKSKGIILSHFAINTNADAIIDYMELCENDCIYIVKTISHSSTLTGELLVALKTHTPVVIAPTIVPPRYIFNNISKYGISIICINPTLLRMYVDEYETNSDKYDLSSLKEIYVHGEKADKNLCLQAKNIFKKCSIYYGYGLSEAGPRVATQKISSNTIDSVGKAIKDVQIVIINENGAASSSYERGMIHVKTPSKFQGYISGNSKCISLKDGFINTGDIGYWDDYNELHIVGRMDDILIVDAHKFYRSDIENHIYKLSQVKECVVTVVKHRQKCLLCCLYCSDIEMPSDIKKKLSSVLMKYEIPKIFIKSKELPRNKNGKIAMELVNDIIHQYLKNLI